MTTTPEQIAAEYLEIATQIGGCGDGNCVILQPTGMHTNGGCRCPRDMNAKQMMLLRALLRKGRHLAADIRALKEKNDSQTP
jgi:hypothetical protein